MIYCFLCGIEVSDGERPVAEPAIPNERAHMAFEHGFVPSQLDHRGADEIGRGPYVCIRGDNGHEFGEVCFCKPAAAEVR